MDHINVVVIIILALLVNPLSPLSAQAWSWNFHSIVTKACLESLEDWPHDLDINQVAGFAWMADLPWHEPHCKHFAHRVGAYQEEFERMGGRLYGDYLCNKPGAEWGAFLHLELARQSYQAKDSRAAERYMGYAIHFIQDALCPSHIFPFREGLGSAHNAFEAWADQLSNIKTWAQIAKEASPRAFRCLTELREGVIDNAVRIRNEVLCSYQRQDGEMISDPRFDPTQDKIIHETHWMLLRKDVEEVVKIICEFVKGAARAVYLISADDQSELDCEIPSAGGSRGGT